jgi:NAD(P)H-nitrite reductase large subunit
MTRNGKSNVIVGNSAACLAAVKAIRSQDKTANITIVAAENCDAYSPVLTKYMVSGKIARMDVFLVNKEFYKENNIEILYGKRAMGLDPQKQHVVLEDGTKVPYDQCLIATGSSPRWIGKREDTAGSFFGLKTIDDANNIVRASKKANKVVAIGAGAVNLPVIESLAKQGKETTVIEMMDTILPENADKTCAGIVEEEMRSRGIRLLCNTRVKELITRGREVGVLTDSGEEIVGDMVLVGIGVVPNVSWLAGSGVKIERGVVVDHHCRTNFENVFAAGDVAAGADLMTGQKDIIATWYTAIAMGKIAGLNMAGGSENYEGSVREFVSHIFDFTLVMAGAIKDGSGETDKVVFHDEKGGHYRKILFRDDQVIGMLLLSRQHVLARTDEGGILVNLIRNRTPISAWRDQFDSLMSIGKIAMLAEAAGVDIVDQIALWSK